MKEKYASANYGPFINPTLREAIMIRSLLKNHLDKNHSAENWDLSANNVICVYLRVKREISWNLDTINCFRKWSSPLFQPNKRERKNYTYRRLSKDEEVAETLNDYFVTINDSLGLPENNDVITNTEGPVDPIHKAILKYSNNPTIKKIHSFDQNENTFHFNKATVEDIKNRN